MKIKTESNKLQEISKNIFLKSKMGLISYLSGINGENKACAFLKKQKYEILQRNFRSKFGELDIIATKDGILHFVEVKFTQNDYEIYERLDSKKYNKLLKTIDFYLGKKNISMDFQLDLLCIKNDKIQFFQNITL